MEFISSLVIHRKGIRRSCSSKFHDHFSTSASEYPQLNNDSTINSTTNQHFSFESDNSGYSVAIFKIKSLSSMLWTKEPVEGSQGITGLLFTISEARRSRSLKLPKRSAEDNIRQSVWMSSAIPEAGPPSTSPIFIISDNSRALFRMDASDHNAWA